MLRRGLKRDILILLAAGVDEIDAYSFQNQMRRIIFDGWYKRSSFGPAVSRLLTVGEIEKIEKKGKLFYRLTSKGSKKLKEDIPILKLASQRWDKHWRIVIFDIKEEKRFLREALRDKLLSLGFGMWQKSVYIIPFDIEQEINQYFVSKKLSPWAVCLVARRADLGNDRLLANKVWKLDELNEEYQDFIEDCQKIAEKKRVGEKEVQNLWLVYQDLLFKDPHLPVEILPDDWLAEKARKEFAKLCSNMTRSAVIRARRRGG